MSRGLWLALLILVLVAAPVTMRLVQGNRAKEVEVERVAARALDPSVLASGTLAYQSEVTLVPEVIGRVLEVPVHEGDQVEAGQLLLRLDPATSLAEIAQLEAQQRQSELNIERQSVTLKTDEAKWRRYQALRSQGIVDADTYEQIASQRELAQVELTTSYAMLKQAQAQLKQSRERLAKTEIRSPIRGTVTAIFIKTGETAVPSALSIAGSELMIVANTASLYAEVNVDETDVAKISVGQQARIVPAAFSEVSWHGEVEQLAISPRRNAGQSKSYAVKIRLTDSARTQFRPGMSCRAEISTRSAHTPATLAVPVQAVQYDETRESNDKDNAVIFVEAANRASRREVKTGITDDTYIEILDGVRAGDRVVVGPGKTLRYLQDGERLTTREARPAVTLTSSR
jgi:HlyD family secretion protein